MPASIRKLEAETDRCIGRQENERKNFKRIAPARAPRRTSSRAPQSITKGPWPMPDVDRPAELWNGFVDVADTKDGSSTYPTRSTVRHLPSFGKTSKKTHTITFLCLQLHSFVKRKLEVPPQQRLLRAADLFCTYVLLHAARPIRRPPVSSGVQTLAGNLTLPDVGLRIRIQRHQLLWAKGIVGAGHSFARILPDTGVSHSFVSQSWITKPIPQWLLRKSCLSTLHVRTRRLRQKKKNRFP